MDNLVLLEYLERCLAIGVVFMGQPENAGLMEEPESFRCSWRRRVKAIIQFLPERE